MRVIIAVGIGFLAGLTGCTPAQVQTAQTVCAAGSVVVAVDPAVASHNPAVAKGVSDTCAVVATLPPTGLAPAPAPVP
jgi:hypothetical protein